MPSSSRKGRRRTTGEGPASGCARCGLYSKSPQESGRSQQRRNPSRKQQQNPRAPQPYLFETVTCQHLAVACACESASASPLLGAEQRLRASSELISLTRWLLASKKAKCRLGSTPVISLSSHSGCRGTMARAILGCSRYASCGGTSTMPSCGMP